ncbi:tripartite tricarboxylate transporter TctB family protein [Shimia ponticola]|uniref:tripartite tricarboxylate transporter TctB family protein n=1 Tax=Shimia ponticola TaxID=2582893 RepID=UPI0011BE836E|nr:tripartite tricarboxylate transporter TctB family protein [Shimia ponticola]
MLVADRIIALGIMALSAYFMWHAAELPIGWNAMTGGPGGGAFPFWLSAIMMLAALSILIRTFRYEPPEKGSDEPFFDSVMLPSVVKVTAALIITVALIPYAGAYIALPLFVFWYVKIYGKHGWAITLSLTIGIPVFLFFFFEATLKILLPKGFTEPYFFPLYAMFF